MSDRAYGFVTFALLALFGVAQVAMPEYMRSMFAKLPRPSFLPAMYEGDKACNYVIWQGVVVLMFAVIILVALVGWL